MKRSSNLRALGKCLRTVLEGEGNWGLRGRRFLDAVYLLSLGGSLSVKEEYPDDRHFFVRIGKCPGSFSRCDFFWISISFGDF